MATAFYTVFSDISVIEVTKLCQIYFGNQSNIAKGSKIEKKKTILVLYFSLDQNNTGCKMTVAQKYYKNIEIRGHFPDSK